MSYNLTNFTGGTNPLTFMNAANEITGGMFYVGALISLFIIIFLATINRGFLPATATSSFSTTLAGIFLILSGGMSDTFLPYFILLLAVTVAGVYISSRRYSD